MDTISPQLTLDTFGQQVLDGTLGPALPVLRGDELVGIVGALQLRAVPRRDWPMTRTSDVMVDLAKVPTIGPEESLTDGLERLRTSRARRAAGARGDGPAGRADAAVDRGRAPGPGRPGGHDAVSAAHATAPGSRLLSVEEARAAVLAAVPGPDGAGDRLPLGGARPGARRARVSTTALPPWDNSAMDGYAIRAADVAAATEDAPVRLEVIGEVAARDGTRCRGPARDRDPDRDRRAGPAGRRRRRPGRADDAARRRRRRRAARARRDRARCRPRVSSTRRSRSARSIRTARQRPGAGQSRFSRPAGR